MAGSLKIYVIAVPVFILLYLGAVSMTARYIPGIRSFWRRGLPFLKKNVRDNLSKSIVAAAGIVVLKKAIYYVHFCGIMQTKSSIWWADGLIPGFITCVFFIELLWVSIFLSDLRPQNIKTLLYCIGIIAAIILLTQMKAYDSKSIVKVAFYTPLLVLKIIYSGKYLGILTGFVSAYVFIPGYRKFKLDKNRYNKALLFLAGLFFIYLIYFGFKFDEGWQQRFQQRLEAAQSQADIEELLDAAHSIDAEGDRSKALKAISVKIAASEDLQWASSIAEDIGNEEIKNATLKKLRERPGKIP